jgi:hypothetical protein
MENSIENYKKLKKKYIDTLFENEMKEEQKVMETKENELKFLLRINERKRSNTMQMNKDLEDNLIVEANHETNASNENI